MIEGTLLTPQLEINFKLDFPFPKDLFRKFYNILFSFSSSIQRRNFFNRYCY